MSSNPAVPIHTINIIKQISLRSNLRPSFEPTVPQHAVKFPRQINSDLAQFKDSFQSNILGNLNSAADPL